MAEIAPGSDATSRIASKTLYLLDFCRPVFFARENINSIFLNLGGPWSANRTLKYSLTNDSQSLNESNFESIPNVLFDSSRNWTKLLTNLLYISKVEWRVPTKN